MIVNLLLLRGNIGKPGAGISPIRGHSNVQGTHGQHIEKDQARAARQARRTLRFRDGMV
jgi:anaerobic selenocysteine-containing dehydrogenase